jgi:hypothetical protein
MRVNAHFSFPYLRNIDRKQDANETYIPKERARRQRRCEGFLRRESKEKAAASGSVSQKEALSGKEKHNCGRRRLRGKGSVCGRLLPSRKGCLKEAVFPDKVSSV